MLDPLRLPTVDSLSDSKWFAQEDLSLKVVSNLSVGLVRARQLPIDAPDWPLKVGQISDLGDVALWCTRPLTWLALGATVDGFLSKAEDALEGVTHQCLDMSQAYLNILVSGARAPDFLSAGLSIPLDHITETAGVRTLFGRLTVLLRGYDHGYHMMVDISYADHFWRFAKAVLDE